MAYGRDCPQAGICQAELPEQRPIELTAKCHDVNRRQIKGPRTAANGTVV
jgi:hypothetical protein